jgi:hypothetical protein
MGTTSKPARVLPPTHMPGTRNMTPEVPQPEAGLVIGEEARFLPGGGYRAETLRRGRMTFTDRSMSAPLDRGGCSS